MKKFYLLTLQTVYTGENTGERHLEPAIIRNIIYENKDVAMAVFKGLIQDYWGDPEKIYPRQSAFADSNEYWCIIDYFKDEAKHPRTRDNEFTVEDEDELDYWNIFIMYELYAEGEP